ncbi:MAG: sulfur carrier protein ThiS [Desulfitobacterium hafniense]|nr:sulfur carrier protein ThiS [Desulfitobacterium hafniense]
MKIIVNGNEVVLDKEVVVKELLDKQKVSMQQYVTVQVYDDIISRDDFEKIALKEGDSVEFLYFMGGGAQ